MILQPCVEYVIVVLRRHKEFLLGVKIVVRLFECGCISTAGPIDCTPHAPLLTEVNSRILCVYSTMPKVSSLRYYTTFGEYHDCIPFLRVVMHNWGVSLPVGKQ